MSNELQKAIQNAKKEINLNKIKGLSTTNYFINRNIELVTNNPTKFEVEFISDYSK